ncbi:MAG: response regulator transcription factor [Myxococcaceae bacterium]
MSAILLVEDDENLRVTLADNLEEQGYLVTSCATFKSAQEALKKNKVDLVVLDLMLPDGDGYQLCRQIRSERLPVRVLMLTARSLEEDLVRGFDAGADDYLSKPYRLRELLARIAALLRRGEVKRSTHRFGPYALDEAARSVEGPKGPVPLTRKEFDLLLMLLERKGEVLSRDDILDKVWGADVVVDVHTVDNFVSSLKKKLKGDGFELKTVRGVGFKLTLS